MSSDLPRADDLDIPQGPALWRCKNAGCMAYKPRTEVIETERKTAYLCPECKRALHVDWNPEATSTGEADQ